MFTLRAHGANVRKWMMLAAIFAAPPMYGAEKMQASTTEGRTIPLDSLPGKYNGNVVGAPLGLVALGKTGYVHVEISTQYGEEHWTITYGSLLMSKKKISFQRSKTHSTIASKVEEKVEYIPLEKGVVETQLHVKIEECPFFGGHKSSCYELQFKFHNETLVGFRVQVTPFLDPKTVNYSLTLTKVEKEGQREAEAATVTARDRKWREDVRPSEKKTDWDF